ncbi:MAG: hypothetical protein IH845_01725 [Nanoarchaeota archaeon]|nr:hypothetical protein [Nanoarchaeota archaeon]
MYSLPQEIEVWYIIPAIRKEIARLLTEKYGLSYEVAGKSLGISKAAISQYLSNKRANKIKLSLDVQCEIKKSSEIINQNNKMALIEIQRILKYMKENKYSCETCKEYNKGVMEYCNADPSSYGG